MGSLFTTLVEDGYSKHRERNDRFFPNRIMLWQPTAADGTDCVVLAGTAGVEPTAFCLSTRRSAVELRSQGGAGLSRLSASERRRPMPKGRWSGIWELNPHDQLGRQMRYRYANAARVYKSS